MVSGKVWLVGAGPGEPGLITVRGLELISAADAVLYDALAHPALLDACPRAEKLFVGKRAGKDSVPQHEISAELVRRARAGQRVVRLKGGDPFLFARGSEEAEALAAAGVPFEIVPGVTSAVAASAYAGVPLTHRELSSSVTFITGHRHAGAPWSAEQWQKLATATDTICVLMGMKRLEDITRAITQGGRAETTPAMVVQWGARPEQRVVASTLGEIAGDARRAGVANPAILVVGEVVRLRETLRWYDTRPLFGKRLLVARAVEQAAATAAAIRERAAEPVLLPLIEIAEPPDAEPLRRSVAALSSYDWVLVTSANGAARLLAETARQGRDARAFGRAKLGAIGPRTAAALAKHGLKADLVADEFVAESFARALTATGPLGRVLVVRALVARDTLPDSLRTAGAEVDVVAAYQTLPASAERTRELVERLEARRIDVVLLTSSSTATSLHERLGGRQRELLSGVTVASIGPVTTRTASELGIDVQVTAETYTLDGLLDALEHHFLAAPDGAL